jgi:hypothetical protein
MKKIPQLTIFIKPHLFSHPKTPNRKQATENKRGISKITISEMPPRE